MTFKKATNNCKVRGYIYRIDEPEEKYAKNHSVPFKERVPIEDQYMNDWTYEDPERDITSIIG